MATDYVVRLNGQDNLSGTIKNVQKSLAEVNSTATKLDEIQQRFNRIEQSTAPLRKKLKDVKALMAQMNLDNMTNTDLFQKMAEQAGAYADALGDAQTATNVFANDNFKLEAMAQGLSGIAGAASIATGVMGLLGKENEDVAKAIMKVQSVLAVLNGVQAVANVLNKDSALMLRVKQIRTAAATTATTVDTVAIGVNTTATVVNNSAQKAWNVTKAVAKALLGDWTGLVLVGAVALGTYALATDDSTEALKEQTKATDKAKEAQDNYNSDLATTTGQLVSKYRLLQNEWKNLKSIGDKTQWIKDNATEFKNLGLKVSDLKSAEDVFVNNTSNVVAALKARAQAMAAQNMLTQAYTDFYNTQLYNKSTVAGGGYWKVVKSGDDMKRYGQEDFNGWAKWARDKYGWDTKWSEYYSGGKFTELGAKSYNEYSAEQANVRLNKNNADAETILNKTVEFATNKINEANSVISANGLNFNAT